MVETEYWPIEPSHHADFRGTPQSGQGKKMEAADLNLAAHFEFSHEVCKRSFLQLREFLQPTTNKRRDVVTEQEGHGAECLVGASNNFFHGSHGQKLPVWEA